jgi:hypothetical protein
MKTQMKQQEWDEMVALKNAISYNPATVHPDKMEKFTELLVKSLYGKGNLSVQEEPSNY